MGCQLGGGRMVWMTIEPVGSEDDARTVLAYLPCHGQTVLVRIGQARLAQVENVATIESDDLCRRLCLGLALLGGAASAHLAAGEIDRGGAIPGAVRPCQEAGGGKPNVIAVCGDGQDIDGHGTSCPSSGRPGTLLPKPCRQARAARRR